MTAHAAIAAVPKTGTPNRTLLQALLVTRLAYVLGDAEDPEAFDPRGEGGSPATLVIGYQGQWFWYDEADSTTGHDGTTCIVASATGGRYKVFGVDLLITAVISKTVTDPPDPDDVDEEARPNNGDAYIVPAAASGDWATWENSIAVWIEARREWFRILPKVGWAVTIPGAARDVVYRYDSVQAAWITGNGAALDAGSVPLSALIWDGRVENQTTTTPPATWSKGVAYIIAGSATGDWSGHDGQLAIAESDGVLANGDEFTIYAPYDGLEVYDKALQTRVRWRASISAWVTAAGAFIHHDFEYTEGSGSTSTNIGGSNYTYNISTPPATSNNYREDQVTLTHQAANDDAVLIFSYECNTNSQAVVVGLFIAGEADARIWQNINSGGSEAMIGVRFAVAPGSATEKTYVIRLFHASGPAGNISHRLFEIMEKG